MENYFSLYFDAGIMQSWGFGSYLKYRATKPYPTQSAVVGMIARASHNFITKIGHENFLKFLKKMNEAKYLSFVFSQNGFVNDYQTIGTNYKYNFLKKADGKIHMAEKQGITVEVEKQFLQDAVSGCIICHEDEDFLVEIANFIQYPLSILGIGRMRCVPSSPIFNSLDSSLLDSFNSLINRVNTTRKTIFLDDDSIIKIVYPNIDGYSINDIMVDEGEYVSRLVIEKDKPIKEIRKDIENGKIS
jgi:hypothetical protein